MYAKFHAFNLQCKVVWLNGPTSEFGRRPLAVHYMSKCGKYWLKQMHVNRDPHVYYNMLRSNDDSGEITWATHVRILLYKYGFGHGPVIARCW